MHLTILRECYKTKTVPSFSDKLKLHLCLVQARSSLTCRKTTDCRFTDMIITYSQVPSFIDG